MAATKEIPLSPFGRRLLEAAETAGFTQSQLEREAKMAKGRLSRLIHRDQAKTDLAALDQLLSMTGVRAEWLLFGRGAMRDEGPIELSVVARAMIRARTAGVKDRTIWLVRSRAADVLQLSTVEQWLDAFLAEHRRQLAAPDAVRLTRRVRAAKTRRRRLEEISDDE